MHWPLDMAVLKNPAAHVSHLIRAVGDIDLGCSPAGHLAWVMVRSLRCLPAGYLV